MLITHVQAVGPFLRVFGQLNQDQMGQIQLAVDAVVSLITQTVSNAVPILAELPVETICLARFAGHYRRARIIGHRGDSYVFVQFIDYGNECNVKIQEIRLLNFQLPEVELLKTLPTQVSPFILSRIYCQWSPYQINALNNDLVGNLVSTVIDAQLVEFTFISIIWRGEDLVKYLIHIKNFGASISLEEQTSTFCTILSKSQRLVKKSSNANTINTHSIKAKSRGLVPVRQLHTAFPTPQINMPIIHHTAPTMQPPMAAPIIASPQIIRMPYRNKGGNSPNAQANSSPVSSPPKRTVMTFKSKTLMAGNFYDVYCCFVENGPCLFSVHLKSTTDELNDLMNEIENIELYNLTERPAIGMACIARFSEDSLLYRAVIMTIKPTACQVFYVDYGNTEVVPFADIYEIPPNLLDMKIFAIRFALSGYKELEPLDDVLKNAFKDMVLHKYLRLKVMPLEGPPLVQYCELYDGNLNILDALKTYKNRQLTYLAPPTLNNNDYVVIRYVESPKKFFVQKVESINAFDQMMDDLFLHCKTAHMPLQEIEEGGPCAVKFENAWYRAEILGVNQARVHIRHVDFGNERHVDCGQLCAISDKLVKFPVQATKCCLKGFERAEALSDSATVQLEMLAENENNERRHFKCQIYEVLENEVFLVNLVDEKIRPELNLMKRLYKLSMPFNKYIGLEKAEYPYTSKSMPDQIPASDYIPVPSIFNSTTNNGDQNNISQAANDWEVKSSHSANSGDSRGGDGNSPSDRQNGQRQNHHSPHAPRPFRDNNSRREQNDAPYQTFKGKNSNLPPRFQKGQDDNRKFRENRETNFYESKRYNSNQSDSYTSQTQSNRYEQAQSQPVACEDEWDNGTENTTQVSAPPAISTTGPEEYVPSDYTYSRSEIIIPSREEIILCWWVSPHQFYTHNCPDVPKFEILMRNLQMFYKSKTTSSNRSIGVGSCVVVRYQKDKVLYRATILAHNEALRKYRVEFVDFGNQATVTSNDIWMLEKRFSEFPMMAQLCSFENVVSNYEHREITSQVEKYLKPGSKLFCNYQRKEKNVYYADIEVNGKSLKESLIEDGSLSTLEPNMRLELLSGQRIRIKVVMIKDLLNFQVEIEGSDMKLMSSYHDIKFVKSNPHLSTEFKANYEGKYCIADVPDVSKEKILMLQPIIPLLMNGTSQKICDYPVVRREFTAKIAFIETENIMYAHSTDVEAKLGEILDAMFNFYSAQGNPLQQYTPGTLCAALSSDGNWYRAKIVFYDSGDNFSVEVYYIDYGNVELIEEPNNIRELQEEFNESSALAIRFCFPIKVTNSADDSAVETIKSLTEGYELTLCIIERYKNCWIADIQSYGNSLINVLKETYSLTNGMDVEHARSVIDSDTYVDFDVQSSDTSNQVQSLEKKPVAIASTSADTMNLNSGIMVPEKSDEAVEVSSNMIPAYLSHCDNPGRFFLHLTSNFSDLQQLQDNIQIVAGSLPPLMTSVTGALCIALYTVDETWYRAKIIDSEIMAVQFIDYGNTDVLTDSSYVKEMNEAFANIPPFAIPCALPISPRKTTDWVDEANNIFNESYEKTLYFDYVTQNPKKNYVNLKIDGINVAEKLIADGLARKLEVLRSGENGFVSHINSLSDFYIQMESYADGLELIAGHLADFENFKVLTDNSVGNVCAAIFPEDNSWYRAKILSHSPEGTEVLFIDYGNAAITNELREISPDIANLPFLSKKCSLRMPDHILGWSDEAEAKFHDLSAMGETVFIVELIEPSDHAIIDLYIGDRNILEDLEPLCDKRPTIEMDLNSSMGKDDFAMPESVHETKWEDVTIVYVNTPSEFYVHLLSEKDKLDQVLDVLNCGDIGAPLTNPTVGMICTALYEDDGAYYRAEILAANEDSWEVLFIDYGNTTLSKELRCLPTGWNTRPALAYQCTLDPNGLLDLSSESVANEFITITTDHEEEVFKMDVIDRSVKPWVVSLQFNDLMIYEELEKRLNDATKGDNAEASKQDTHSDTIEASSALAENIVENTVEQSIETANEPYQIVEDIVDTAITSATEPYEIVQSIVESAVTSAGAKHEEARNASEARSTLAKNIVNDAVEQSIKTATEPYQIVENIVDTALDNATEPYEIVESIVDNAVTSASANHEAVQNSIVEDIVGTAIVNATEPYEIVQNIVDTAVTNAGAKQELAENTIDAAIGIAIETRAAPEAILDPVLVTEDVVEPLECSAADKNEIIENIVDSIVNKSIDEHLPKHTGKSQESSEETKEDSFETADEENLDDTEIFVAGAGNKYAQSLNINKGNDSGTDSIQSNLDVVITQVYSSTNFYVRLRSDELELQDIQERIKDHCVEKLEIPRVGDLCAVLDPDQGNYHRAKILNMDATGISTVELIDSGIRLDTSELFILPHDLALKPALAKHCKLKTTQDINSNTFKKLIESNPNAEYRMNIIDNSANLLAVDLFLNGLDVHEELAATNFVQKVIDSSLAEIVKDAVMSHTNSPNDFYVQFDCDVKNLEKITDSLQDALEFEEIANPVVGMICAAVFPDDGAFYRAKILSILEDDTYEVLFIDFGNESNTKSIRALPDDLKDVECIAKQCALENCSEIDFWSDQASNIFSNLVASHFGETFQVEIKSMAQMPWIVKLYHQSTDLCVELKKLIDENTASHDSSDLWEEAKDSSGAIVVSDILDDLISSLPLANGEDVSNESKSSKELSQTNESSNHSDASSNVAYTSEQLAQQLWDELQKRGVSDSNMLERASSTSNLCDNNSMKSANSVTALLSEQSNPTRSKSVECVIDNK